MRRTSIQGGNLEGALLSQAMRNKKGLLLSTIVLNQENSAKNSSNISTMAFCSETCFIIMILVPGGALS